VKPFHKSFRPRLQVKTYEEMNARLLDKCNRQGQGASPSAFDAADQTGDRGSRRLHHHSIRRKITAERKLGIESFLRDGNCDSFSVARGAIRGSGWHGTIVAARRGDRAGTCEPIPPWVWRFSCIPPSPVRSMLIASGERACTGYTKMRHVMIAAQEWHTRSIRSQPGSPMRNMRVETSHATKAAAIAAAATAAAL
jgi:hypothetical protein